jgi:hypothetical protein
MNKTSEQLLIDRILSQLISFRSDEIAITSKVKKNTFDIIEKILTHQNNGFQKTSPNKRFFFNFGNSRVDTVIKKIDLDTKNISIICEEQGYSAQKLLLDQELKNYFKYTSHGIKLNAVVEEFCDFGNVVVKKDENEGYKKVNITRLFLADQTAETLEDTDVGEIYTYNISEFRRASQGTDWHNINETIEMVKDDSGQGKASYVNVIEWRGEISLEDFKKIKGEQTKENDKDKYIQVLAVASASSKLNKNNYLSQDNEKMGFLLFLEEALPEKVKSGNKTYKTYWKPYREAHFGQYKGLWFREGVREVLFDLQDRANVIGNQLYEAMKWSSKHILWSKDQNLAGKSVFKSIENGQVILAEDLNVLPIIERNLSAQVNEWNKLMVLADKAVQSFEVATGEGLPSGTTLGAVQIQSANVGEHFDYKREKLGLMLKDVFNHWVLDDVINDMNAEHILEMSGDNEYFETVYQIAADGIMAKQYAKINNLTQMTKEDWLMLKEQVINSLKQNPDKTIVILKDFYKDIKFKFDVDITGESFNKQNKVANTMGLLQFVANPAVMQDPVTRAMVRDLAALIGINVPNAPAPIQQPQPQQQAVRPPSGIDNAEINTEQV